MKSHAMIIAAPLAVALVAPVGCGGGGREAGERAGERRAPADARRVPAPPRPADPSATQPTVTVDRPPPTTTRVESRPLPVPREPALVKQGRPPLVYLVETPTNVAVIDRTTGQRLAAARVSARTIVRIEPRTGVIFGDQTLAAGPMPADHEYGIYLESDETSEVRELEVAPMRRRDVGEQRGEQQ